jgi:uncharacterized membrane protein required for colicin V production
MLLDLVVILFLLLGLIVGWQQGLFKFVKKILPFFGALIIAGFLCKLVADQIYKVPEIGGAISRWVESLFKAVSDKLTTPIIMVEENGNKALFLQGAEGNIPLIDTLKESFGFLGGTVESILIQFISFDGTSSIASAVIPGVTVMICYVLSYVALFLVLIIAIAIMTKIISKLMKKKFFKYIDRFFGAIAWAVLVIFVMYILLSILMLFETESAIEPFMNYLKNESDIARIMYNNNIFLLLLGEIGKSFGLMK